MDEPTVRQPSADGSDILQDDLHAELAHWTAVLHSLLAAQQASQGGSTGTVPIVAPAAAQPPASALPAPAFGWPPGVVGRIAQLIYSSSMRPVPEVATATALGLLAGVCGRSWVIPKSGLNLYIVLVAQSGVGKEAMHDGISMFRNGTRKKEPKVDLFFDFTTFASGPALIKAVAANPCFLHINGEFGRKLKAMSNGRDPAAASLRTEMTTLYTKSGEGSVAGGINYSNKENNVSSVSGACYSMIGETTPGTFLGCLTPDMMEDGFMSRLLVIEYDGDRPKKNAGHFSELPEAWANWFASLVWRATELLSRDMRVPVQFDMDAQTTVDQFDEECDREINRTKDESRRQMWNRAALKVLRIVGLLAVADNPTEPMATLEHVEWAIRLIRRDIALFSRRLDKGEIGGDDHMRERALVSILRDYLTTEPVPAGYKVPDDMRQNSIVPRSYLQTRAYQRKAFNAEQTKGQSRLLDDAIYSAVNNGYLMEVDKLKVAEAYNHHGKAYRIIKLPDYAAIARDND